MRTFLLFDFDGVIADTYKESLATSRVVHPHLAEDEWLSLFEGNIHTTSRESIGAHCTDECLKHDGAYFEIFQERMKLVHPFEGIVDSIRTLSESHTLAVISSSVSMDIMLCLRRFGIVTFFSDVLGKDVHTSKVEKIKMILDRYEAKSDNCLFITDTLGDMKEATEAHVGSIGVSWGFHSHDVLQRGNPFRIIDSPAELPRAVDDYFARSRVQPAFS